jgi:hypothetical protein
MLSEPVMLWGGPQKGRDLLLALGSEFVMMLQKKNFRTHQGRDQESLLVKQSKERIVTTHVWCGHIITDAMRAFICPRVSVPFSGI